MPAPSPKSLVCHGRNPHHQRARARLLPRRMTTFAFLMISMAFAPIPFAHTRYKPGPTCARLLTFVRLDPRPPLMPTILMLPVLRYYGPAHLICPEILTAEAGTLVVRQIFQYALDDALLFEAMMAVSQAGMTACSWSVDGPDKDALLHYNRTVSRLRSLLGQNMAYSQDAVLFAIVALMGVDVGLITACRHVLLLTDHSIF